MKRRFGNCLLLCVSVLAASALPSIPRQAAVHALSPAFGHLDTVNLSTESVVNVDAGRANTITVAGWAATSDFPTTPLGVRVRYDSGTYHFPSTNYWTANGYGPDVGIAYPGYGDYHGFSFDVPVRSGTHVICIEAQNSGVYNSIGCRTVNVTGSTFEGRFFGPLFADLPGTALTVRYTRGTTWRTDIDTAANRWDPAAAVEINATTSTTAREVAVLTVTFPTEISNYWGFAKWAPWCTAVTADCGGGDLPWVDRTATMTYVYLNLGHTAINGTTPAALSLRRKVVAHEFGHVLGLAHPPTPGTNTVMAQGELGGFVVESPAAWDFESMNHAYK